MLDNIYTVLIFMVFAHIVDDYYLQGILANLKQKSWWEMNSPDKKYRHDYIVALICHSFSWAVMILIPILIADRFVISCWLIIPLLLNIAIHAFVDDLKANKRVINLIIDQYIHLCQIVVTWIVWICV